MTNLPGVAAVIETVGGTPQTTPLGAAYSTRLQAAVTDVFGNPIANIPVTFTAPTSGATGSFGADAIVPTNALGVATAPAFMANDIAGSFTVTATAAGAAPVASFELTNDPVNPTSIRVISGNDQSAAVNSPYSNRLAVQLTDGQGNPAAGVPVTFTSPAAGASGNFGVAWGFVTPITTDVATLTQSGTVLEAAQWGSSGTIAVTGSYGTINFQPGTINSGGGAVADTTAVGTGTGAFSGSTGNAAFDSVLSGFAFDESSLPYHTVTLFGLTPGQTYSVQLFGLDDRADGESGRVNSYADGSGLDQSSSYVEGSNSYVIGTFIAQGTTESVRVNLGAGQSGNINALVVRSLPSSGGGITVVTNAAGIATAPAFTANQVAGNVAIAATDAADALTASWQLTNSAGAAATITAIGGATQNTIVGTSFNTRLQVQVTDAFRNPIANAPVTFTAPLTGASGSFNANATISTNALGIATAPAFTADQMQGSFIVTATVVGTELSTAMSLSNTAVPTTIKVSSGAGQLAVVGSAFAKPLVIVVTGAGNKPVSGITVKFEFPGSGPSGTFTASAAVVTNAKGVATAPSLTAGTQAGSFAVDAWVAGVGTPAVFMLSNTAGSANAVNTVTGVTQSTTVGKAFATALVVNVVDQFLNPVVGTVVTFTVQPSNGAGATFPVGKTTITEITNGSGTAHAPTITANGSFGVYSVTATVAGVANPATFNLTNIAAASKVGQQSVALAAKIQAVSGTAQRTKVNTAFAAALTVVFSEANGHVIAGMPVTFSVQPSDGAGATFNGLAIATSKTTATGKASAPALKANGVKGSFTVLASALVDGVELNVTFDLTSF